MRATTLPDVRLSLALLIAVAILLALGPAHRGSATSFDPHLDITLSDTTPGAATDITLDFSIDAPDANFQAIVSFLPLETGMATDADVPDGALAGRLDANATLGLFNGGCNNSIPTTFDLVDATTDTTRPYPLYVGWYDNDFDGLPDNVTYYPDFLTRLAPGVVPRERLYGQGLVAGAQVILNFVVFEPGARIARLPEFDASLGYPVVVYLDDPTAAPRTSNITDFCTPLSTTATTFGVSKDNPVTPANEAGHQLRTAPTADGTYNAMAFVRSRWDADTDGIENHLDPCPFSADPSWDPRAAFPQGDADYDGLPASCDPDDNDPIADQDDDLLVNRWDNCPLIANAFPVDSDQDGLGDPCDPEPDDQSNGGTAHRDQACVFDTITVGAGGSAAPPPACPDGPDVLPPLQLVSFPFGGRAAVGRVTQLAGGVWDPLLQDHIPNVTIHWEITGANPGAADCVTNQEGYCETSYAGINLGLDTITTTATVRDEDLIQTTTLEWVLAPPNDDFANAEVIPQLPYDATADLVVAGNESGETSHCYGAIRSVWYKITPDHDTVLEVMLPTDYNLTLGAYVGSAVDQLSLLACSFRIWDQGVQPGSSAPTFTAQLYVGLHAGETYYIQAGFGYSGGDRTTPSSESPPPLFELHFREAMEADTTCDGTFDGLDVISIMRTYATYQFPSCPAAGDLDCIDGLTVDDAIASLKKLAGLPYAGLFDCQPRKQPPL